MKRLQGTTWSDLERLIGTGDDIAVAAALAPLDEAQRRTLAKPLEEYAQRLLRAARTPNQFWWSSHQEFGRISRAVRIALIGCVTSVAAVVKWMRQEDLWFGDLFGDGRTGLMVGVVGHRPMEWQLSLATRVLQGRPTGFAGPMDELALELFRRSGAEPALTPRAISSWMHQSERPDRRHRSSLAEQLRTDPLTPWMVPGLFAIDDVGPLLVRHHHGGPEWSWPVALADLARTGDADRAAIVDGCLRGLLRGGNDVALRGYRAVLEQLEPDLDDLAPHAATLVRLVPDSPSPVATLALTQLQRLADADWLPPQTATEAVAAALTRSEKKVPVAALAWLETQARTRPEALLTATIAFRHPAVDVQRRAVMLIRGSAPSLTPAQADEVRAEAESLPTDLRAMLAGVLGAPLSTQERPAVSVVGLPPSRPAPEPIGSVGELAEELASTLAASTHYLGPGPEPLQVERTLAALIRFAHQDRDALAAALAPVLVGYEIPPRLPAEYTCSGRFTLQAVVGAAVGPVDPMNQGLGAASHDGDYRWRRAAARDPAPARVLLYRMYEAAAALAYRPVPQLVATPTMANGQLEPARLLARLARAAEQGWRPLAYDLEQALLRLPREADPLLADRAQALGTAAGMKFAERVRRGVRDDPVVAAVPTTLRRQQSKYPYDLFDAPALLARVGEPIATEHTDREYPLPPALTPLLTELPVPSTVVATQPYLDTGWLRCWSTTLPSHRDVLAAHLVATFTVDGRGSARVLPLLAECDGPAGQGLALAIAWALSAELPADRAATVDAILLLHARGNLDGASIGADLGQLVAWGEGKLSRAVPSLQDVMRAGGASQVWPLVAAALEHLLPQPNPAHRLPDLITVGFEAADALGHRGTFDALATIATQTGGGRTVTEARRLHRLLTSSR